MINNIEEAKAYFYKWYCNRSQMGREWDKDYSSYIKIATRELEEQWTQEYLANRKLALQIEVNSSGSLIWYRYSEICDLLEYNKKSKQDINDLLKVTKNISNSISNYSKERIVGNIMNKVIPITRYLNLFDEAREFLHIVKFLLAGATNEKLLEQYIDCAKSLQEIETLEQAKEYFIKYDCKRDKMKYDFKKIASSYLAMATEELEKQWTQEAFERKISMLMNKENRTTEYSFFYSIISLFSGEMCNEKNTKLLLHASYNIIGLKLATNYSFPSYARGILDYIVPELVKNEAIEDAREFLNIAEELMDKNSPSSRDSRYKDTLIKLKEWKDIL